MLCPKCGRPSPDDEKAALCLECQAKAGSMNPREAEMYDPDSLRAGVSSQDVEDDFATAGFWIRVVSTIIDGTIITLFTSVFSQVFYRLFVIGLGASEGNLSMYSIIAMVLIGLIPVIVAFAISLFYIPFFEWSRWGATPGKQLVGLKVVDKNGFNVKLSVAFARQFLRVFSGVFLCMGYLMAAFSTYNQTAHDYFTNTFVVKIKPVSYTRIFALLIACFVITPFIVPSVGKDQPLESPPMGLQHSNIATFEKTFESVSPSLNQEHRNIEPTLSIPPRAKKIELVPTPNVSPVPTVRELSEFERRVQAAKKLQAEN